ncbi:GntR family transcriptional regulator [Neobacillus bataviensis LMG 21833]|uniref:GntR family transcriptional regulator n=1 Tax=Neobacillus bataviensis LMG 21833 TaxID=1117379 RepID=K6DXQ5_9BACI|nr:GntR family transcriptional regulator [Neobacillus bataviensis]EKN65636.1 GntR family transcriptional regulator [Neobacillus bataviensis LMG 21833]
MKIDTVEHFVYNHIKTAILARKLAPGKQLVENRISDTLKVSRTPIRNALKNLASEGLVDIVPNKGAFVTSPTLDEIIQAYELRGNLEFIAASKSMDYLTEKDFSTIRENIEKEKLALADKNTETFVKVNKDFHLAITEKCNNKFLNEFIERLITQTNIYLILYDEFFNNQTQEPYSPNEHSHILSLIEQKKETELKTALENHFKHSIKSVVNGYNEYKELDEIF